MSEDFKNISEAIGFGDFTAEIEDGKFIIAPADAGVMLFGYITISEKQLEERENRIELMQEEITWFREDNSYLRDILERAYQVLVLSGHQELADECIEAAYPVRVQDEELRREIGAD